MNALEGGPQPSDRGNSAGVCPALSPSSPADHSAFQTEPLWFIPHLSLPLLSLPVLTLSMHRTSPQSLLLGRPNLRWGEGLAARKGLWQFHIQQQGAETKQKIVSIASKRNGSEKTCPAMGCSSMVKDVHSMHIFCFSR